ncbi:hypothetical protein SEMRO_512_G157620.1 [Seminavis robusta]|uniref:Uncharacterized protein n=1 Tax=Seminavis robusta TaxID=568900 RepID=A0A9N8E0W3_9STRA|nr:hypothetical protein SEMRO_512_G157620.1 [Seminavis robusta]|eukprot:Sro512_g157620.1 n/a (112) ;mRNA; f:29110-29445
MDNANVAAMPEENEESDDEDMPNANGGDNRGEYNNCNGFEVEDSDSNNADASMSSDDDDSVEKVGYGPHHDLAFSLEDCDSVNEEELDALEDDMEQSRGITTRKKLMILPQ